MRITDLAILSIGRVGLEYSIYNWLIITFHYFTDPSIFGTWFTIISLFSAIFNNSAFAK